jgi:hypothetical protein
MFLTEYCILKSQSAGQFFGGNTVYWIATYLQGIICTAFQPFVRTLNKKNRMQNRFWVGYFVSVTHGASSACYRFNHQKFDWRTPCVPDHSSIYGYITQHK